MPSPRPVGKGKRPGKPMTRPLKPGGKKPIKGGRPLMQAKPVKGGRPLDRDSSRGASSRSRRRAR